MVYFEIYLESFGNIFVGGVDFIFILDFLLRELCVMLFCVDLYMWYVKFLKMSCNNYIGL